MMKHPNGNIKRLSFTKDLSAATKFADDSKLEATVTSVHKCKKIQFNLRLERQVADRFKSKEINEIKNIGNNSLNLK